VDESREKNRKGKNKENLPPPNHVVEVGDPGPEDDLADTDRRPVGEMDFETFLITLESVRESAFHSADRANDLSRTIWEHMRYRWM